MDALANSTKHLSGKVALVTGAARNMGRAYSEALAEDGASLVIHYHGEESRTQAEETARLVESYGGNALCLAGDLTKVSEVQQIFGQIKQTFGRLDILINNAGLVVKKPFSEITEEDFERSFAINTKAAFFAMQEAARSMADDGRIINIGTTLLGATTAYYSVYAGSKAPLEDFTRAAAKELGGRGITVNTVAPGPLNTSFFYPVETPESIGWLKAQSISGDLGEIKDIVPLIRFLASPQARWITAQTIFINGGFLAR